MYMNCPRCRTIAKMNDKFCRECGFPLNMGTAQTNKTRKLKSVLYDAEIKALFVNGILMENVTAFSLKCEGFGKCSLVVSKDDCFVDESK